MANVLPPVVKKKKPRAVKPVKKVVTLEAKATPEITLDYEIRKANPYDVLKVCRILIEWIASAAKHYPEPEPAALAHWALNTLTQGHVFLAERPKDRRKVIGIAGMVAAQVPWNPNSFVYRDQFFYVPKAHKDTDVAKRLMSALQIKAAQDETPLIMSVVSGTDIARVDEWYGLSGNEYVGGTFVYGLPENKAG